MSNKIYNHQQALEHAKNITNSTFPFVLFRVKHNPFGLGGIKNVWFTYDKNGFCLSSAIIDERIKPNDVRYSYSYYTDVDKNNPYEEPYVENRRDCPPDNYIKVGWWGDNYLNQSFIHYNNTFELVQQQ